jgi:hypothetical protein
MIAAIKLADGNTILELDTDTGEITERGKSFPVLHRPVDDTWELFKLLLLHRHAILTAYQKSKKQLGEGDIRVVESLDNMPSAHSRDLFGNAMTC